MTTTTQTLAGELQRPRIRHRRVWDDARGAAGLLAALALWAWFLAGVAAPLGAAVARLH